MILLPPACVLVENRKDIRFQEPCRNRTHKNIDLAVCIIRLCRVIPGCESARTRNQGLPLQAERHLSDRAQLPAMLHLSPQMLETIFPGSLKFKEVN